MENLNGQKSLFKIAVVPLDDRPCCEQFPTRIGEVSGHTVIQPSRKELGNFLQPGNPQAIKQWLNEHASSIDGAVIAIDQLAYGGLVASRSTERTLEQCMDALQIIPEIKRAYPKLKIFAASVLMRLSITYKNKEYLEYGMYIFQYSQLYDRVHRLGQKELEPELGRLKSLVPAEVLQEYLDARKRNHEINKTILNWCAEGIIDYAVITQEDASPEGMHIAEQKRLMEQIYTSKIQHKAMVYPGADEAVHTLLARMLQQLEHKQLKIYPRFSSTAGRLAIADYEDRPVEETVKCHILAAGSICVDSEDEADFILYVNTPLAEMESRPRETKAYFNSRHNYWDVVQSLKHDLVMGKKVALADVSICNSSDLELVQYVLQEGLYLQLLGYAGWNTAGNTLGTVIGHSIAHWLSQESKNRSEEAVAAHYSFMVERLMDEWAYQAQVRGVVNRYVEEKLGINVNDLEDKYKEVNSKVQLLMQEKFDELKQMLLAKTSSGQLLEKYRLKDIAVEKIYLPWNRTFEVYTGMICELE